MGFTTNESLLFNKEYQAGQKFHLLYKDQLLFSFELLGEVSLELIYLNISFFSLIIKSLSTLGRVK